LARPAVDVVVPFAGSGDELLRVSERLECLDLGAADTLTIVDNRPPGAAEARLTGVRSRLVRAPERQSSYHARNRGAAGGGGEWIVFLDADVTPPAELLDLYFEQAPAERTAVLAGGVLDEPLEGDSGSTAAARYAVLRDWMSQENSLGAGRWAYAQTANCAVRRRAFEAVGGFTSNLRSGGDGDLCFRLRAAGWELESRDRARVVHRSRRRLGAMLRQRARHGSGAAWLNRAHPGSFPRRNWPGLAKWTLQSFGSASLHALRGRRDDALLAVVDPLEQWAFEIGRLAPNEVRPRGARRSG
jgi:glycosyltransferase involved in cell wall biosynthesis